MRVTSCTVRGQDDIERSVHGADNITKNRLHLRPCKQSMTVVPVTLENCKVAAGCLVLRKTNSWSFLNTSFVGKALS